MSNEIIGKAAVYTASNARHKGQANLNPPSVNERRSSILLSLHLIVDFLSRMKQNGCFIFLDFTQFLPVNVLKKLDASFIHFTFHTT